MVSLNNLKSYGNLKILKNQFFYNIIYRLYKVLFLNICIQSFNSDNNY